MMLTRTAIFTLSFFACGTATFVACSSDETANPSEMLERNVGGQGGSNSHWGGDGGMGGASGTTNPGDDLCVADQKSCEDATLYTCNSQGTGFVAFETCPDQCRVVDGIAQCADASIPITPPAGMGLVEGGDFSTTSAWELSAGGMGPPTVIDGMGCLTSSATLGWLGSDRSGLTLEAGSYTLQFTVSATMADAIDPPSIEAKVSPIVEPWTPVYGAETFTNLVPSAEHSVGVTIGSQQNGVGIAFNVAVFNGDQVCLDDVKLIKR